MTKPVTPQDMFDLWQKMVNPGAYPLQSLMFPVLDAKELEKKIGELQVVEHWLRANLNMLQLSIKSLEYQRMMLKGGEKAREAMANAGKESATPPQPGTEGEIPNPAMWAWNMMAQAGREATDAAQQMIKPAPKKHARKRKS
jgi:hypothetical protein